MYIVSQFLVAFHGEVAMNQLLIAETHNGEPAEEAHGGGTNVCIYVVHYVHISCFVCLNRSIDCSICSQSKGTPIVEQWPACGMLNGCTLAARDLPLRLFRAIVLSFALRFSRDRNSVRASKISVR